MTVKGKRPDWFPDWRGETVVTVAGGSRAATVNLECAKGRAKFIAINDSWKLADGDWRYPQNQDARAVK
jgi:hypothetical protein